MPTAILRGLDQESPTGQKGMRLTFQLLLEMSALCAQHDVQFIVAVIPTKEMVCSRYLEHNPALGMSPILDRVIASERAVSTVMPRVAACSPTVRPAAWIQRT